MANQLFSDGDVIQPVGSVQLECVSVSYSEENGEKQNFVYSFRSKAELDAEREAASNPEVAEVVDQPEEIKEETQYVK